MQFCYIIAIGNFFSGLWAAAEEASRVGLGENREGDFGSRQSWEKKSRPHPGEGQAWGPGEEGKKTWKHKVSWFTASELPTACYDSNSVEFVEMYLKFK